MCPRKKLDSEGETLEKCIDTVPVVHTLPERLVNSLANLDKLIIHITVDRVIRMYLPQQWAMSPRLTTSLIHLTNHNNKTQNFQALLIAEPYPKTKFKNRS
jgi:hypothetical protein